MSLALLLSTAAAAIVLVDETYRIPATEWRFVNVVLKQQTATLDCEFMTGSNSPTVRLALVNRKHLESLRGGEQDKMIASTPFQGQGRLRSTIREPGEYAVIIDNRGATSAEAIVQLKISVDFSGELEKQVRYLSPERRFAVILTSLVVFAGIATYSARKLWSVW